MKLAIAWTLLLFGLTAFSKPDSDQIKRALESATACSNFVSFDDRNLYLGFGPYRRMFEEPRSPIPGALVIIPLESPANKLALPTADGAIGALTVGQTLYVLTYTGLEEWDVASRARKAIYPTFAVAGPLAYKQHAQAFARWGDKLIIAQGRLGVSFFDLKNKRLTNQFPLVQTQNPLESMATGVAVAGDFAYVLMDNFSLVENGKPPFRGFVMIDLKTERVVRELDGLDPFATAVMTDGHQLLVSFGGTPIWKYPLTALDGSKMPEPTHRVFRFPLKGAPTGRPSMDDKYIYTCFAHEPASPGSAPQYSPLALDRRVLLLD